MDPTEPVKTVTRRAKWETRICAGMHALGVAVLFIALVYVVPQFQEMFEAQGGQLPGATQGIVSLSVLVRTHWFAIVPLLVVLLAFDFKLFARMFGKGRDRWAWGFHVCVMLVEGLVFVWIVVSLFLPLRNLYLESRTIESEASDHRPVASRVMIAVAPPPPE